MTTLRETAIAAILAIDAVKQHPAGEETFQGTTLSEWEAGVIADAVLATFAAAGTASFGAKMRRWWASYVRSVKQPLPAKDREWFGL